MKHKSGTRAWECPSCGRISPDPGRCRGALDGRHAPVDLQPADELREALELDERG